MLILNNPGNIRRSVDHFVGELVPSVDTDFKQFSSMAYGYRAMFLILKNYGKKGVNTLAKIIERYAPRNENETAAYIDYVSKMGLHKNPNDRLDLEDKQTAVQLVSAMSYFENGRQPVPDEIEQGWKLLHKDNKVKKTETAFLSLVLLLAVTFYVFKKERKWK